MANGSVLFMLFGFGAFQKGLTALIQTQQTVLAAEGDEALLNCQLVQSKDVLQVTWQKLLSEGVEENIATYNKYFGQRVNAGFEEMVKFKDAGLQNSSIILMKVTEKDEGCYRCLFNTYPEGALTGTTCLKLTFELPKAIPHVAETNSPEETVVSESAADRPAPTETSDVTWIIVPLSVVASCCIAAIIIAVVLIKKHRKRDSETIKTPLRPIDHTTSIKTPLIQQENEQLRLRTSTGEKGNHPKPSSSTGRCQRQLCFTKPESTI
ncbi:OX-2 membrane glycoprotein-like [Symphorus nematophorus]